MTTCVDVVPEQVCYISCNFCHIVLAVSVPCSSLLDIVTVRCGHCTNLWSVNMAAIFHQLSRQDQIQGGRVACNPDYKNNMDPLASSSRCNKVPNFRAPLAASNGESLPVNRQPEKRQRVPSAYNQFIKEEIQRIKANNPDISHREAFSTAAKNWAHFPYIHFGLNLEPNKQAKLAEGTGNRMMSKAAMCNE